MLKTGHLLDNTYEIKEQIGEGGGGIVYHAFHTRLQKDVVVKLIRNNVRNKLEDRAEADILKRIKHSYLPQVYDFLEIDGDVYTVMDFIPGKSFAEEIKCGTKFTQKQIFKWAQQLCEALNYLHNQKPAIIHSDIKPANIMLTPENNICLIDFNVSQLFGGDITLLGRTDGYAPPEHYSKSTVQLPAEYKNYSPSNTITSDNPNTQMVYDEGKTETAHITAPLNVRVSVENKNVNELSDIYSLGATLYHILTGIRPNIATQSVKPLSEFKDINISDGLLHIISTAMQPNPKKRFSSASEMLRAVQNIHKLDRIYKKQIRKRELAGVIIVLMFAASALLCIEGVRTIGEEKVEKYNTLIQNSQTLIDKGEIDNAIELSKKARQLFPKRVDSYYINALALYKSSKFEESINYIFDAKENRFEISSKHDNTSYANLDFILANSFFALEQYEQASAFYENAIEFNPDNSEYYRDYAISQARMGNLSNAQEILNQAESKGFATESVLLVKGEIAFASGEYQLSAEAFEQAFQQAQDVYTKERSAISSAKAYSQMATTEALYSRAELLEKAYLELPPPNNLSIIELLAETYTLLGTANQSQKPDYYQKAISCFEELLSKGYSRFYIVNNIAILHQELNNFEPAINILESAKDEFKTNYKLYMQLAFIYADMQQQLPNEQRDYTQFITNYNQAEQYYKQSSSDNATDMQMLMLQDMMNEIKDGGWLG